MYLNAEMLDSIFKESNFEISVRKIHNDNLHFDNVREMFIHLRDTGVNGLKSTENTAANLLRFARWHEDNPHEKLTLEYVSANYILRKPLN